MMMAQMLSDLHGVVIKWNTTQPRTAYTTIKMSIILELSTEEGHFQVLSILCLLLIYTVKYIFNHLWHMTPLMDK